MLIAAPDFGLILWLAVAVPAIALAGRPPRARRKPHSRRVHGVQLRDNYHWLREKGNPEVHRHLKAENAFTRRALQPVAQLREKLFQEMVARIQETDASVPYRKGPYYYYHRSEAGRQYPIYCRKRESLTAPEEVILDLNQPAVGRDYLNLGLLRVSPSHSLLAYSIDVTGSEEYTVFIKDLSSGLLLDDRITGAYDSLEWGGDDQTLFYNRLDPYHRPFQLLRHRVGMPGAEDVLVFQEDDEAFFLSLSKTRSRTFLLLTLESNSSSEVHYLDARDVEADFRVIQPRRPGVEYSVDHRHDFFYLTTNDQAREFRLVKTPIDPRVGRRREEVMPHDGSVYLEEVVLFETHMAVFQREGGFRRLRLYDFREKKWQRVEFEEEVHTLSPEKNPEFRTDNLRLVYSSLTTPESVYDCDLASGRLELLKREPVRGGFSPEQYESRRIHALAPDGVEIPISMVYRRGAEHQNGAPLLLYGYGAYGISIEPSFNLQRLSLLDRGVTFAIAHVRGGEELGRRWYEDGKLLHKENTFHDFIACAETLIDRSYTTPDRLAVMGGSAGGLLMGVAANRRPDLFRAVVARVPFVDVVNTMLDPSLPLTVTEYDEWGDPRKEEYFKKILAYSPYDNVRAQPYPAMLVTAGLNDPRVSYWEPAKWIAKLRELGTGDRLQLLHIDLESGHAGASGRYEKLKETAMIYAFLLDQLGVCRQKDDCPAGAETVSEA